MNRRRILGGLLGAPFGARVAAEQAKASALGLAGPAGLSTGNNLSEAISSGGRSVSIGGIADFMRYFGEPRARHEARMFRGFDADILEMRLPTVTKRRMQYDRDYARALEEMRQEGLTRLLKGPFEWWF